MQQWKFTPLSLKDAYIIEPFFSDDSRGGFIKDYSKEIFEKNGISYDIKEVFYTISLRGVIRAIHFQKQIEQAKLVRCVKGKIYDVIIDLRPESPFFSKWEGFYLTAENMKEVLVPKGFGHGYLVIEDSIVSYKCDERFVAEFDDGIRFDDEIMNIKWPYDEVGGKEKLIISHKDFMLQSFEEFKNKL